MRRREREVKDINRIMEIIEECRVCRLAFSDESAPYIVPLNYGCEKQGDLIYLYFHCAHEGRKIDLIKKCPRAGFELDCFRQLVTARQACGYTAKYSSITGFGDIEILSAKEDKLKGLRAVMRHYSGSVEWDFPDSAVDSVCVMRLAVKELSCKENI